MECVTPAGEDLAEIRRLAGLGAHARKGVEGQEFLRLRGLWLAAGGECLHADDYLEAMIGGEAVVKGGALLHSELWGDADLSRLNRGVDAYRGPFGLAELGRDIALATGTLKLYVRGLPPDIARIKGERAKAVMDAQGWKSLVVDWRRIHYMARVLSQADFARVYSGEVGYENFAGEYFEGDMERAYQVAAALLSPSEFAALGWGKVKQINVEMVAPLRSELESGRYNGMDGYDRFAEKYFRGKLQKAYQVASALLTKDAFAKLGWGMAKKARLEQQPALRALLLSGYYHGEAGYDKFALGCFEGNLRKAYQVASTLLSPSEFAALGWGMLKEMNVEEEPTLRALLLSGDYQGEAGYDKLTIERFHGDPKRAHHRASRLLTEAEFDALGWGRRKIVHLKHQAALREALASGSYGGKLGRMQFVVDQFERLVSRSCSAAYRKAYVVASSLMQQDRSLFDALGWIYMDALSAEDERWMRDRLKR